MGRETIFKVKPPSKASLPVKVPTRTQDEEIVMRALQEGRKPYKADPYYSEVGKHYTPYNWDEIDMSKVDLGFHIDPTPEGIQAADRAKHYYYMGNRGLDDGETKDLRFKVGNTLVARDIGWWDQPSNARVGILDALYEQTDLDTASRFERAFPPRSLSDLSTSSKIPADQAAAAADMQKLRKWLLDEGYDTIQYKNTSEGADLAAEDALLDPDWLDYERDMLEQIENAKEDYWKDGLGDSDAGETLRELEDELEYERDKVLNAAAEGNISYIALDPGNVRSANAKFDPKNYGKPGMMLGAGGLALGLAGGSNESEAGTLENARKLAANSGATQVATTGGTYAKAGRLLDEMGAGPNRLDYGSGLGHGTAALGPEARSLEVNPKPGYEPDFTESPDEMFDGIANLNVLNVVPEPIRSQIAQDILGKLNVDGVAAIGARSYPDVMGAKNPEILDDGGIVTSRGTYQYGFGGENEGLVPYLERQAEAFPDKEFEITKQPLAATGAAVRRIKSLLPFGTLGALSSLTSEDASAADLPAGILDVANRTGEMLVNDALSGSQSLSNAIYDTRDVAPQVQFAPRTEAGDTLSEGLLSDLGDVINYRGLGGNMPSLGDAIQGGVDLYNEYVSPYLSDRQEMGLGGALLAASTLFPGGKANKIPDEYSGALGKTSPRIKDQARLETTNPVVAPREGLQERNIINLEDYIGRPYLSVQYDPSATGTLTSVQGAPLRSPVELTGGQDYMRGVEPGRLTASGENVLNKIDLTRRALKAKYGEDPLFIPSGMQKTGGDFNHMQVATMAEYAGANMPADTFKKMAQEVKEKTGIDISDPAYITGLSQVTGDTRKAAQDIMDKYRNQGGISVGEARLATHDPGQVYDNFLNSPSMNMGVLSDSSEFLPSRHGTYPASNMGSYEGTFSQRFPVMALDPARLKEIVSGGPGIMTSRNVDINNVTPADIRSMSMAPVGGILEEENVMRALEAGKRQYKVGILGE